MTIDSNPILQAALEYQRKGFSVIPVHTKSKKPCFTWKGFQKKSATEEQIKKWWGKRPKANIGIVTGEVSGIVVVDIDKEEIPDWLPETLCSKTSKGWHYYYKYDPTRPIHNNVQVLGENIDIRGEGGYVVAPPSTHESGEKYEWRNEFNILELAEFPYEIFSQTEEQKKSEKNDDGSKAKKVNREGSRNNATTKFIGSILKKIDQSLWDTVGWEEVKRWNNEKNSPPLDEDELRTIWNSIKKKEINSQKDRKSGPAEELIELVINQGAVFFHTPLKEPFVRIIVNDHLENFWCKSEFFKHWLGGQFWDETNTSLSSDHLNKALGVFNAKALFSGKEHQLNNRVSEQENIIWYDLVNEKWQAVKITKSGWKIENEVPVLFERQKHQKPHFLPQRNGDVKKFLDFINIKNKKHQLLILVWLISCFVPNFPHPILIIKGQKGAAKSGLTKLLREVIDPSVMDKISFPKNAREFPQLIGHHWLLPFDNIRKLTHEQSDMLCKAVTGDSVSVRELFETLFRNSRYLFVYKY